MVAILHFIDDVRVVKDNIFETPPIFDLIQKESGTSWEEMYTVFNMGQRMEVYLNKKDAQQVVDICKTFDIDAQIIGYVEACDKAEVIVSFAADFLNDWTENTHGKDYAKGRNPESGSMSKHYQFESNLSLMDL